GSDDARRAPARWATGDDGGGSPAGPRPRPGPGSDEGLLHLRQRHPGDLPGAPGARPGGVPGRNRRPRAVRRGRCRRSRLRPRGGRRPGGHLPHRRLRPLPRLPRGVHDLLHRPRPHPRRLRLAARRRARGFPARRGVDVHPPPGPAELRRRRPRRLRLRDRLRGTAADGRLRPGSGARHRPRAGRPCDRPVGEGDGRLGGDRDRRLRAPPCVGRADRRRRPRPRRRRGGAGAGQGIDRRRGMRGRGRLLRCPGRPPPGPPGDAPIRALRDGRGREPDRVRRQPDAHPPPDHPLRLLGDERRPHGGVGRETGRVESEAGGHRHPPLRTGPGRRGVPDRRRGAVGQGRAGHGV
ncbi:MAG: Hypothetical zinc-type alcohol dehydrogenase-like protein YphC, partial [uncultured Thermomicrobiales bacterium]